MAREDRELLLRDWQLERRQLQMENQRLTKLLDEAHKHIRILRKQRFDDDEEDDDGVMSVSSLDATIKAGSSHKLVVEKSLRSTSKRQRSFKIIAKIFARRDEGRDEANSDDNDVPVIIVAPPPTDTTSCAAVCDVQEKVILEMPKRKLRKTRSSSMVTKYLQILPDVSFDSTEATSRASSEPRLAEF
jgi:hypothetical protein